MSNEPNPGQIVVETFRHEDDALSMRTDWFLIFHAIMLEAYFDANAPHVNDPAVALGVSLFGLICAALWLAVGIRQWTNQRHLRKCLNDVGIVGVDIARIHNGIGAFRDRQSNLMTWAQATPAFAVVIPLAATLLWCLLVASVHGATVLAVPLPIIGICVALVLVIAVMALLKDRPKISDEDLAPLRSGNAQEK